MAGSRSDGRRNTRGAMGRNSMSTGEPSLTTFNIFPLIGMNRRCGRLSIDMGLWLMCMSPGS